MKTKSVIADYYPNLTKTEKKIADFIMKDFDNQFSTMTLSELSNHLSLGEASIVRFCQKIQFKGFQDLKFALALDDAQEQNAFDQDNYMDCVASNMMNAIHETRGMVNAEELSRAITLIHDSDYTYFFGVGSSAFVAEMAEERFLRIGKRTKCIKESHIQCAQASICNEHDVIVAISLSGATSDLLMALRIARTNGCRMIAITNHELSPIAQLSDMVLITCGKENPVTGGTLTAMTTQMYIVDLLCTGYSIRYPYESKTSEQKVSSAINEKLNQ